MQGTRHFVKISVCSKYRKLRKIDNFDNAIEFLRLIKSTLLQTLGSNGL